MWVRPGLTHIRRLCTGSAAGGVRPRPRVGLAQARRLAWPRAPLASGAPRLPAAASRVQRPGRLGVARVAPAVPVRGAAAGGRGHGTAPVGAGTGVGWPTPRWCACRCARLCARAVCSLHTFSSSTRNACSDGVTTTPRWSGQPTSSHRMRILRPARQAHAPQGRMCTELSRPLSPQLTTHLRSQDFDADHVAADRQRR